jgi:hypothetical protein
MATGAFVTSDLHHDGMDSSRYRCGIIAASADVHQRNQEETEMDATTVAVDVAKSVFELAIANAEWRVTAHPSSQSAAVHALRHKPRRSV